MRRNDQQHHRVPTRLSKLIARRTVNPHNNKLSCGGSSGGEGALIALRGSILGLATDIGGSIRIPAGFNGLCGIRPSHGRMPYNNLANSLEGQETIQSGLLPFFTFVPLFPLSPLPPNFEGYHVLGSC